MKIFKIIFLSFLGRYRTFYLYIINEIKFIKKYLDPSVTWKRYLMYKLNKRRFVQKYLNPPFDWVKSCRKYNPYYLKWGFKFPMYEFEYYAACSGVKSDLYLPIQLFARYIYPYLNYTRIVVGYSNKNMLARMLDMHDAQQHVDVLVPESVACCENGRFFRGGANESCTYEEAVQAVLSSDGDLILKPALLSAHGDGVMLLPEVEKTESRIRALFAEYGNNFIVQKKIIQHPELAKFNPTSVNTIRIVTYQDFKGKVKILYATQRFGGKGRICDNADPHDDPTCSGGFCAIGPDGTIAREVHHMRSFTTTRLSDDIAEKIPYFEKVRDAVLFLHTRFPHHALIAWDVSVTPDGHPLVVEYNFRPGLGTCQLAHGPVFSREDLDEIMARISKGRIIKRQKYQVSYPSKEEYWIG